MCLPVILAKPYLILVFMVDIAPNTTNPANQALYDVIFFDMDGTLLPIEVRDFLVPFYQLLEVASQRVGYDAAAMRVAVNDGIFGMYDHPETETNAAAFWRGFFSKLFDGNEPGDTERRRLCAFLDDFYAHDFNHAGEGVVPNPAAQRAIRTLYDKGYPLYLTTMPMFPLSAIKWRMKWAACDIGLFSRVTTFDNSTSVKPYAAYYQENIQLADVAPERILMVGNNTTDDLACLECGMDAYLVTDYLINHNDFDIETVKHGSLEEFADWTQGLPPCTSTHALSWRKRVDALRLDGSSMEEYAL